MLEPDCFYTIKQLQTYLEMQGYYVPYRTIAQWIENDEISYTKLKGKIYADGGSFNDFFSARQAKQAKKAKLTE